MNLHGGCFKKQATGDVLTTEALFLVEDRASKASNQLVELIM